MIMNLKAMSNSMLTLKLCTCSVKIALVAITTPPISYICCVMDKINRQSYYEYRYNIILRDNDRVIHRVKET